MQQSREIELKLEVPSTSASSILARLGSNARSKRLTATYYDTPEGALGAHGISFRVRRAGDVYVQTIKADRATGGALFNRAEWEQALPGAAPDFGAIDETGLRGALNDPADWSQLTPIFTVNVDRSIWDTELDGSTDEVVFDRGSVLAGGMQDAVSEIEIELKAGPASALFGLARWIAQAAPVRLGVLTKAERGQRLLSGKAGRASKSEPLTLPEDATTAAAFAIIVEACLRHFRLNEPLIAKRDAAGLHQARVALRRLRSAISLFHDVVADESIHELRVRLRKLAAILGDARNLDVLIERMAESGDTGLNKRLRAERESAYDRAVETLEAKNARLLMLDILEWAAGGAWRIVPEVDAARVQALPAHEFAARTLDKYRRRVKKRGSGLADLEPEPRHQVRIEAKKLRYAAEFFSSLFADKKSKRHAKTFMQALEALQANLGTLNDIATAHEMASDLAAKGITLPAAAGENEGKLLRKAQAAHDDLIDARPFWR